MGAAVIPEGDRDMSGPADDGTIRVDGGAATPHASALVERMVAPSGDEL